MAGAIIATVYHALGTARQAACSTRQVVSNCLMLQCERILSNGHAALLYKKIHCASDVAGSTHCRGFTRENHAYAKEWLVLQRAREILSLLAISTDRQCKRNSQRERESGNEESEAQAVCDKVAQRTNEKNSEREREREMQWRVPCATCARCRRRQERKREKRLALLPLPCAQLSLSLARKKPGVLSVCDYG